MPRLDAIMRCWSLALVIACGVAAQVVDIPAAVDVLIYTADPAGIGAMIAAAEQGATVLLVEPLKIIGLMGAAGGVGLMNQVINRQKSFIIFLRPPCL